jgi:carboxylesterase
MSVAEIGRTSEVGMPLEKFTKKLREDLSVENSYIPNAQAIKIISNPNSKVAILIIHGFTGSVASISPWVKTMATFGFNVCAPLLPGHGTTWKNLNQTRWQDWFNSVEEEFKTLKVSHQKVFIAGFSMGGALALRLAQIYGNEVSGLILINPSIEDKRLIQKLVPLIKYFLPRTRRSARKNGTDVAAPNPPKHSYGVIPLKALASLQKLWKLVAQNLYLINQPLLLGISPQDHVVNPDSAQTLLRHINSVKVTQIEFPNSYHNVALDYDLEKLCTASRDFINEIAG